MIDFYNLIVHFIRSLCICTWSLFLLLYVVVQFYPWFEFYLPLFSRHRCVTSLKTAAMEPSSRENCYKLTSGRSTELKLWSIGGEFNRQTNKFGFSTVYHEFRARFRGGKDKFWTIKAKLKRTLEKLVCAKRRTENCPCISIFAHILKLLAQIDLMFSVKYFCGQYFKPE